MDTMTLPYGGEPPAQAHSATSKAAAASIKRQVGPLHEKVLGVLEQGATTDEHLCVLLDLSGNTLRPRRRELQLMGLVRDSGLKQRTMSGRNATVWELVWPPGSSSSLA